MGTLMDSAPSETKAIEQLGRGDADRIPRSVWDSLSIPARTVAGEGNPTR
jgi:hypothetical protein